MSGTSDYVRFSNGVLSASRRPQPRPMDGLTRGLLIASAVVYVLTFLILALTFAGLPQTVPTHFDASGRANSFGPRAQVWIGPTVLLAVGVVTGLATGFPRISNVPRPPRTAAGWQIVYRLVRHLLGWLTLFTAVLGALVSWQTVLIAHGRHAPGWPLWTVVAIMVATTGYYVWRLVTYREPAKADMK